MLPVPAHRAQAKWLATQHQVCIVPGSSCGSPGHIRVAFANLRPEACLQVLSGA